jgi:hypothetical protein
MARRAAVGCSVAVAMMLFLGGCSVPPDTLNSDASGITLRWNKDENDFDDVERTAQVHCASTGRRAVLADDWTDQHVKISRFACR